MVFLLLVVMSAVMPSDSASAEQVSSLQTPASYPAEEGPLETEKTIISFMIHYLDGTKGLATGKTDDQKHLRNELDLAMKELNQILGYLKKGDEENAGKVKMTLLDQFLSIRIAMDRCKTLSGEQLEEMEYRVRTSELKLYNLLELEGKEIPVPATTTQGEKTTPAQKGLEYSVKLICGETVGKDGLEPGRYSTVINIRNSSEQPATLKIQAVEAKSLDAPGGTISPYQNVDLKPGAAIKVDCATIRKLLENSLPSPTAFIEGFAVINSTAPLDVFGVYTGAEPEGPIFYIQDYSPGAGSIQPTTPPASTGAPSSTEGTSVPAEVTPQTTEPTVPTTGSTSSPSDVAPATEKPQGPGTIIIEPVSARNVLGTIHVVTIKVFDTTGKSLPGAKVHISQSGTHHGEIELVTNADGKTGYQYIGKNTGTDMIVATVGNLSATATKEWYVPAVEQPTTSPTNITPKPETGIEDLSPGVE